MKIYTDPHLLRAGLIGGTLSRHSGNMRELDCQSTVFHELGIDPTHILHLHQIHSDTIISINSSAQAHKHIQSSLPDADAWAFAPLANGWGAAIVTADCVPLLLWDDSGTYVALAHCGWRGVVKGLPYKVAKTLLANHPPLQLNAWLGPHIQACCFEVQSDVAEQFSPQCLIHKQGKIFVDLNAEIKKQLIQAGLGAQRIRAPHYCTCEDTTNFFSWRRDHAKNLLLSFLYKP